MKDSTRSTLIFFVIIVIVFITLFISVNKLSKIEQERKDNACKEIGYEEYFRSGNSDYCLISDNLGIKIIMFYGSQGHQAIKLFESEK